MPQKNPGPQELVVEVISFRIHHYNSPGKKSPQHVAEDDTRVKSDEYGLNTVCCLGGELRLQLCRLEDDQGTVPSQATVAVCAWFVLYPASIRRERERERERDLWFCIPISGFELAGNVKAVGSQVKKWREGDRVMVLRCLLFSLWNWISEYG